MGRFVIAERARAPRLKAVDRMTGMSGLFADILIVVPGYNYDCQPRISSEREPLPLQ